MKNKLFRILSVLLTVMLICLMFTGCATTGEGGTTTGSTSYYIIMMVVILVFFYFLMLRPEQKKKKKAEEMRQGLSIGNEITTIGGMVGRIVHISEKFVIFETGEDRVRIQVAKWAISSVGKITEEEDA